MKAFILAAGRGERLRPLTDKIPKPLVSVAGQSLIEYHLHNLANANIKEVIINTAWLAEKIHQALGDGSRYTLKITYSDETEALETAGGIVKALPLLGDDPFVVVNGDIWTDFDFATLQTLKPETLAHLVLVDNPAQHPNGDFAITENLLSNTGSPRYTYSGIGIFSPRFFSGHSVQKLALAPLLRKQAEAHKISAQHFSGKWTDVGSAERLQILREQLGTL